MAGEVGVVALAKSVLASGLGMRRPSLPAAGGSRARAPSHAAAPPACVAGAMLAVRHLDRLVTDGGQRTWSQLERPSGKVVEAPGSQPSRGRGVGRK